MKINQAELMISAVKEAQYPKDGLPEFVLAGRSNVGKSSFINKMIGRKNLARTSSKPGKTQTLNFYKLNDAFYFVDVPGYGFARVSKTEREAWGQMIETYLANRETLKMVLLIIDVRHAPTKDDKMMYEWLKYYEIPTFIIATKVDKIPKGKQQKHLKMIKETLNIVENDSIVLFSAETGVGKEQAWNKFKQYL